MVSYTRHMWQGTQSTRQLYAALAIVWARAEGRGPAHGTARPIAAC